MGDRTQVKKLLKRYRAFMEQMEEQDRKGYVYSGEVREVPVEGETHKVRFYDCGKDKAPAYLDIHGGGMAWGGMTDVDPLAVEMVQELGIHVYALDYPLVPETEYPRPLEYLYGTVRAMVRNPEEYRIDPERLIVGGRSAGGNLTAALCLMAAERGEFSLAGQILDHPWLDLAGVIPWESRPALPADAGFLMTEEIMANLALGYAPPERQKDAFCTPLLAPKELLRKTPKAIVQTAEYDTLAPEGERYANLLRGAGVEVCFHCYPKALHAFSQNTDEIGRSGRKWIIDRFREMFL